VSGGTLRPWACVCLVLSCAHLASPPPLPCAPVQASQVEIEDVSRVYTLFVDVKRSTQYLMEYQEQYMFNEVGSGPWAPAWGPAGGGGGG
jgi:hypothetical protein